MTYERQRIREKGAREPVVVTNAEFSAVDRALFEQDARIAVLEAALVALDARVVVLEEA